ncbi:MAG: MmgE/PrpD family protein [Alphaproteobacteria bacterium]|nr:MmgE/PrpD family protein [Alphaproteobacteria bacterium]
MSIPTDIACHVLRMSWDDVPPVSQAAMKAFLLDTLAVGVAGRRAWLADPILHVARSWGDAGDGPKAAVWGGGPVLPVASAAFVNGFQIHCQEYDCVHEPAVVHPMAVIGAAVSAEAEARDATGADYLAALTGAVDVAAGLGAATQSAIRFFRPATAGLFGATLGVARLRGLDVQQSLDALGYALAQAAGTMQAHVEGKPALPVQIASAARAAIVACDLAEAGLPGPHHVFDGPYGYLPLFEECADSEAFRRDLSPGKRIGEVSYKPFPTGRAAQGGIVLMQRLRELGVRAEEVQSIRLIAPPLIERLVGRRPKAGMQINYARLCFAYSGAVALKTGTIGLADFTAEALNDAGTLALADKITVESDGSDDPAAFAPQIIEAKLTSGGTETARIDALYGSPTDPMREADVAAKRAECLAFGFGEARADLDAALVGAVEALPQAASARPLITLATSGMPS